MPDAPHENPYQSPDETDQLARQDWGRIMEFVTGTVALLLCSAPIYYYVDPLIGAAASGLVAIVVVRSVIDVRRKLASDCLAPGGVWRSLATSIFFVCITGVAAGIAFFTTCLAAARVFNSLYYQYAGLLIMICFGTGGVAAFGVGAGLLYCLGPAKVESLPGEEASSGGENRPESEIESHEIG